MSNRPRQHPHRSVQQLQRALRLLGNAVCANRVASRSEGQDRQLGPRRAALGQPVHDLVDGAVPPERRDQLASLLGGLACQLDGVPWSFRECHVELEAQTARVLGQPGPAPSGGAVLCRRVDDDVGRPVSACLREGGADGELGHALDGGLQLAVGDADELALDDDVGDRQQAGGLHAPQRRDREEDRGLHLDRQDAAVGPALRPAAVGVVERARRDAGPDADLGAIVLGLVHGGVHELEVGGGGVRLPARVREHRGVAGDGRDGEHEVAELHVGLQSPAGADTRRCA